MQNRAEILGGCNYRKGKYLGFAGMVIQRSRVAPIDLLPKSAPPKKLSISVPSRKSCDCPLWSQRFTL